MNGHRRTKLDDVAAVIGGIQPVQPEPDPDLRDYENVPLNDNINDYLRRAELLYPDRVAIVDEPDQPAESWGEITYAEMARRVRAMAAGLDELGQ